MNLALSGQARPGFFRKQKPTEIVRKIRELTKSEYCIILL